MKIIWHGPPAFYNSGYGVQSREFIKRLQADGHEVSLVMSTNMFDQQYFVWEGIEHYPGGVFGARGIDGVYEWSLRLKPDCVITLFDIWDMPEAWAKSLKRLGVPWLPIVPLDSSPMTDRMLKVLEATDNPIAMSLHGQREMKYRGIKSHYFPHGVDTNVFKPAKVSKADFGYDEKTFIVGCVANNVDPYDRKGLRQTIEAFGKFKRKHPNSEFFFHGQSVVKGRGVDVVGLAQQYGFEFKATEEWQYYKGLTPEQMAEMYNLFDVFLLLTGGEGFGVPIIEAQACDTPVITTDFSAPSDLVAENGWKVPVAYKRWTPMSTYWGLADVENAVEALSEAHRRYLEGVLKDGTARKFALDYDLDTVYKKYLVPILKGL